MGSKPGLRKQEDVFFVKAYQGQDTNTSELLLEAKGAIAQNTRFSKEPGSVYKRPPIAFYNSTAESNPIQSTYRYYKKSTSTQYLIQFNGTTLRVGNDSDGTFSTIATLSSSSGHRFTAVTYNDLALISTGYDNIIQTDGTVGWELGSCKAALKSIAGGSVTNGAHYYAVVFTVSGVDIVNGAVSNTVTTSASYSKVDLSYIPLGPAGTTARKVYRTEAGGSTLKLLTTISDNTTTTYTDNIADGSLGATMAAVNNDMPKGAYLYITQERLFVTGDPSYPNYNYYSEYYLPHYILTGSADLSTTAASDYYDIIGYNDNDIITGIKNFLGTTYIFKQNSIRPYYVEGTPSGWKLGDPVSMIGCPAPYSIVNTPYGLMFQGWDHLYMFNGNFVQPIADEFPVQKTILASKLGNSCAEYHDNKYWLAYTDASLGHQYNDRVLIYDFLAKTVSIDKGGPSAYGSVNINCFCSAKGGSDEGQLYSGDSVLGFVYKHNSSPEIVQYQTKTDMNSGTHTDAETTGLSDDLPVLTRKNLDNMDYVSNESARAAWISSETTSTKKVPPDLGTGADGDTTISSDTTISAGTYNYTSLTINSSIKAIYGKSTTIKCLGDVTVSGTLYCGGALTIYAKSITVGSSGVLAGNLTLKANKITNSGTITGDAALVGTLSGSSAAIDNDFSTACCTAANGSSQSASSTFLAPSDITSIKCKLYAYANGENCTGTARFFMSGIQVLAANLSSGSQTIDYSSTAYSGSWVDATSCSTDASTWNGTTSAASYEMQAFMGTPSISYADTTSSVGTIRPTPSVDSAPSDFVNAIDVFTESSNFNEGVGSIKIQVPPGADSLNETITKTITAVDLSGASSILIDVYSLRTGTNIQFGLGEGSLTDFVNIPVTASNTWETVTLDISGITNSAIDQTTKIGIKFTNTDSGNILYIDNIRPATSSATWTSPVLQINASRLGNMYWNENLGSYGDVQVYTRNASTSSGCTGASWSSALSNPSGSSISSTGGSSSSTDMQFFQFKITLTTTDPTYVDFPYCYKTNGYLVKMDYYKTFAAAETSVEWIYDTGYRNFDKPLEDKIFKKIVTVHEGTAGTFTASYRLDYDQGDVPTGDSRYGNSLAYSWASIDLTVYPRRWESFYPDHAFGRTISWQFYKDDAEDFKLKQVGVVLESEPII